METWLVTGGAGFIGSNFIHYVRECYPQVRLVNLDKLTYAGHLESIEPFLDDPMHIFVQGDIGNYELVLYLLKTYRVSRVVNFAAESHVDRSIEGPAAFVQTNVVGTFFLLEACRAYWNELDGDEKRNFRFLHVSTDEVYGSLGDEGFFTEATPYAPNSPYAASKAASDHFVRAYVKTYGLPALLTNCSNNYGPYQYPEKLIPLIILNAVEGRELPVYGDGLHVRDWLYVRDHCEALCVVLQEGKVGEHYNIGGESERTNIDVVGTICDILGEILPPAENEFIVKSGRSLSSYRELITFVEDRPGHDRRYAMDISKIKNELGWRPRESFDSGIRKTVKWYLENMEWCNRVTQGLYDRRRLGLIKKG
ncbi:dTDP-glucose 4,6-dehydratase [Thermodesulforhabdus norvegica]|uniref:dTDP-glucose 4,6-dehydratase n=1 Tax=Thermodesulforhabdus norvegica TaxID=39841 RepID=A0A1I4W2S7_9BACT|nr:dTDP-glucose 4,6-dehydratase [Thermodesulforhabdus norvegica]SFN07536.1 dTDP-glucose 4,6-dehydratase [Thermodesulforhabdus norvegica]